MCNKKFRLFALINAFIALFFTFFKLVLVFYIITYIISLKSHSINIVLLIEM